METIKIAHLYYDLMNLYGEHGNVRCLTHHLESHDVRVIVHNLSIDDKIKFDDYDIFYIGSGSKESFLLTLNDLMKRKEDIIKAYNKNKFFFVTGNALDFFGESFTTVDDVKYETLGLFKYQSYETDFRIVGEQVFEMKDLKDEVIGFENRNSVLKNVHEKNLFTIKSGTGYAPNETKDGILKKHFYGTYLLGPLFIRNPYFTEKIIKEILRQRKLEYKPFEDEIEITAYHEYQKNLLNEKEDE